MGVVKRILSSWTHQSRTGIGTVMKTFLAVTLFAVVLGHQDQDFNKWAKNKAMESCFGEKNMQILTVQMKKAVAKCSQQDAPELQLLQFRAPYKTVNALLDASKDMENTDMQMMFNMFRFMHNMQQKQNQQSNDYTQFRPYSQEHDMSENMPMPMKWMLKMMTMKPMEQNNFNNMKNSNYNYKTQGMFGNLFEMRDTDMDYGNLFNSRQSRALDSNLNLGDRLVEKLQGQKDEMETTLPAELEDGYIVEGEFGKVNMAQVKTFMSCCTKGKAKLCMNQDIKQKIEENFGPVAEILTQSGLTENQLFPLVQDLLHGQESYLDDLF